jgi:hypothetical protein
VFIEYSLRFDKPGEVFRIGAKDNHTALGLMGVQGANGEFLSLYENGEASELGILIEKLHFDSLQAKENYMMSNSRMIPVEIPTYQKIN